MSFDLARKLLGDVLPLDAHLNAASIRNHLQKSPSERRRS